MLSANDAQLPGGFRLRTRIVAKHFDAIRERFKGAVSGKWSRKAG